MDPKLAKRLSEIPEVQTFIKWIDGEAAKLDRSSDIESDDPVVVAIEVKARKLAHAKIMDIIEPIFNAQAAPTRPVSKDYAVDVDEPKK